MTVTAAVPSHEQLARALRAALAPTRLEVIDESGLHAGHAGANGLGFGTHFRVRIDSPLFAGKPRVAQHRLVYDALRSYIDQGVHAIAIEVLPPVQAPANLNESSLPTARP
ncbi:MAG: BolA family transcriptional regulator [Burkholderiales bacterium]|nr:BolA family transcriptional regulator [Burkholderiales bacterium]